MSGLASFGILLFVVDLWAVISVFGSDAGILVKLAWAAIVVLLPVVGFVMWLIAGPSPGRP